MEKSWTPIGSHCKNFNSLILSCHTWNISKKCSSRIYKQWKSELDTSWECFMYENSELSCWFFLQWGPMGVHDFSIVKDRILWAINHCFRKPIPHPGCKVWHFRKMLSQQSCFKKVNVPYLTKIYIQLLWPNFPKQTVCFTTLLWWFWNGKSTCPYLIFLSSDKWNYGLSYRLLNSDFSFPISQKK